MVPESVPEIVTFSLPPDHSFSIKELADSAIEQLAQDLPPPELHVELLEASNRADPTSAASRWVQARVRAEIAAAENAPQEDQLARLTVLSGQLESISTAESVDSLTTRLAGLLGTERRAEQPAAQPVAGEFDFDAAQIHDVKRTDDGRGGFAYTAILLDAQGRTLETPLSPAEGEQLYKVMELVKANPLLERIYRGLVMSLLDKTLKPQGQSGPP
jgi:hypothetical protein